MRITIACKRDEVGYILSLLPKPSDNVSYLVYPAQQKDNYLNTELRRKSLLGFIPFENIRTEKVYKIMRQKNAYPKSHRTFLRDIQYLSETKRINAELVTDKEGKGRYTIICRLQNLY